MPININLQVTAPLLRPQLILSGDAVLAEIFWLSVKVSLTAVLIACAIGLPTVLAVQRFPGAAHW